MRKNKTVTTPMTFANNKEFDGIRNAIEIFWKENRYPIVKGNHTLHPIEELAGHNHDLWLPILSIVKCLEVKDETPKE